MKPNLCWNHWRITLPIFCNDGASGSYTEIVEEGCDLCSLEVQYAMERDMDASMMEGSLQ